MSSSWQSAPHVAAAAATTTSSGVDAFTIGIIVLMVLAFVALLIFIIGRWR